MKNSSPIAIRPYRLAGALVELSAVSIISIIYIWTSVPAVVVVVAFNAIKIAGGRVNSIFRPVFLTNRIYLLIYLFTIRVRTYVYEAYGTYIHL